MRRNKEFEVLAYCCPCPNCDKEYKSKFNLKKHFQLSHLKQKLFVCDICQKSLSSKQVLEEHLNKHNGIKRHKCETCYKEFRHYSHLALHRKKHDPKYLKSIIESKSSV